MRCHLSRRHFLGGFAASAAAPLSYGAQAKAAPASPVAIGRCKTYNSAELVPALAKAFDQIGGLSRLVKNKTVAIKVNLTGSSTYRLGYLPAELTHYTHPAVIAATAHLLGKAGARRIRILEGGWNSADPLEEVMLLSNWEPRDILNAAPRVEMENTNWLGGAKKYSRFQVPGGGWLFPAYDFNHSYEECDVLVSLAKMKEHATVGVTGALKNHFGSIPTTIYGDGAGKDEPSEFPRGGRTMMHTGHRQPATIKQKDPNSPRNPGWRMPRIIAEICAARPIDLAIVEAVSTMTRGEGPWVGGGSAVNPGLLVAGLNPVCTDSVCTALMGFDPMADRGVFPFQRCDNHLRLAEEIGIGTRDLKRIEVVGTPIREAVFPFRPKA